MLLTLSLWCIEFDFSGWPHIYGTTLLPSVGMNQIVHNTKLIWSYFDLRADFRKTLAEIYYSFARLLSWPSLPMTDGSRLDP